MCIYMQTPKLPNLASLCSFSFPLSVSFFLVLLRGPGTSSASTVYRKGDLSIWITVQKV